MSAILLCGSITLHIRAPRPPFRVSVLSSQPRHIPNRLRPHAYQCLESRFHKPLSPLSSLGSVARAF